MTWRDRHSRRLLAAAVIGLSGTGLVLQSLDWINRPASPPARPAGPGAVDFVVAPRPREQIQHRQPERRPRPRRAPRPQAPLPELSTALSGVSFGVPPISTEALVGVADGLFGAEATLDDVVMTASAVDRPPSPALRVPPRYPPRARAEGVTGQVKLRMLVGQDGSVVEARVLDSTPSGIFDQAALSAIRRWRYQPATYRGQPVKMWAEMVLRFDLG